MAAGLISGALQYLPLLAAQLTQYWASYPLPHYIAAQVDQESGWKPRATLRTSRELGAGFGQFTKTFTADGRVRFDALGEMRAKHKAELAGWSWANPYDETMQLRALVLKNRDNWQAIRFAANDNEHTAMMLVAYNGGLGRVLSDRNLCRNTPGCDPARWWGNIEHTSLLAKTTVKGYGRSFFQINREYPQLIMRVRAPKYVAYFQKGATQ